MKLLTDENIYRAVVEWLRSQGHDVKWIAEISPGVDDDAVLEKARQEGRIIVSADLDFGELIVRQHKNAPGFLLLRMGALSSPDIIECIQARWAEIEINLPGNLIVLTPRLMRKRPLHLC